MKCSDGTTAMATYSRLVAQNEFGWGLMLSTYKQNATKIAPFPPDKTSHKFKHDSFNSYIGCLKYKPTGKLTTGKHLGINKFYAKIDFKIECSEYRALEDQITLSKYFQCYTLEADKKTLLEKGTLNEGASSFIDEQNKKLGCENVVQQVQENKDRYPAPTLTHEIFDEKFCKNLAS